MHVLIILCEIFNVKFEDHTTQSISNLFSLTYFYNTKFVQIL